ncbi:olfactory receptor 11L1-like [Emys orbicularis]|uniref:olfactory receptor 11L1-like n=1 Tax=Emys orbicularis TaxID=82168 RepID=UPI0031FE4084
MEKRKCGNQTSITEFNLLDFRNLHGLQILLFLLFLVIYTVTMAGNILIVALVVADQHLHTPMYFFLGNLSCLETCYTSTILPRMLASLLTGDRTISFSGCIIQLYSFGFLVVTECFLLAAMSYDRYLAICKPLHYSALMNGRFCLQLAAGEIDHFFCDFIPLLKLSCSDTQLISMVSLFLSFFDTFPPFLLTVASYIYIITTILRIPSTTGRQKAFSTCSSHLIVVTVFYGTLVIVYMLPKNNTLRDLNKVFSVFYTVLTPLLNPLIYSLRNKHVNMALRKVLSKFAGSSSQQV